MAQKIRSHQQLKQEFLKLKQNFKCGQWKLNFVEIRYLLVGRDSEYVFLEFKSSSNVSLQHIKTDIGNIKSSLENKLKLNFYFRQIAFNGSTHLEIYVTFTSSPKLVRKNDSGVSSDSSVTKPCVPRISFMPSSNNTLSASSLRSVSTGIHEKPSRENQCGDLQDTIFSGQVVKVPVLRTSTSQQTDDSPQPPISTVQLPSVEIPPPEDYHRLAEITQVTLPKVYIPLRKYLAYYSVEPDAFHEGESKLDIKMQLISEGMNYDDSTLKQRYYTALNHHGFSNHEITADLTALRYYLQSRRVQHVTSAQKAHSEYYSGRVKVTTKPPIAGPPGRCDPECCHIV